MSFKEEAFKAVTDDKLPKLRQLLIQHRTLTDETNDLGRNLLQHAAYLGREKFISPLVATYGMNVNSLSQHGKGSKQKAPIHLATEEGHLGTVKAIAACKDADLTLKDASGKRPLHYACKKGHSGIVQFLISNEKVKAEVDAPDDKENLTSLHLATSVEEESEDSEKVVSTLLDAGAKPDKKDAKGRGSLHRAAGKGHAKASVLLINFDGTDINSLDDSKRTPLHYAAENGRLEVVKLLCGRGALTNLKDKNNQTPLDLAMGHDEVFEYLSGKDEDVNKVLEEVSDKQKAKGLGKRKIHVAAKSGNVINVQGLISKKADLNVRNKNGNTPLHIAARGGYDDIVSALLAAQADPSIVDKSKVTPLHKAAINGHEAVIKALCDNKKTDVNAEDENNETPLGSLLIAYSELAEKKDTDPEALVKLLVETYGAVITEANLAYARKATNGVPADVLAFLEAAYKKATEALGKLMVESIQSLGKPGDLPPLDLEYRPRKGTNIDKSKLPPPPKLPVDARRTLKKKGAKGEVIESLGKPGDLPPLDLHPKARRATKTDLSKLPPPRKPPTDAKRTLNDKGALDKLLEDLESIKELDTANTQSSDKKQGENLRTWARRDHSSGEDISASDVDELASQLTSRDASAQNSDEDDDHKRVTKETKKKTDEKENDSSEGEATESDVAGSASEVADHLSKKKKIKAIVAVRPQPEMYKNFFDRLDKEIKQYEPESKKNKILNKARKDFIDIVMQIPEDEDEQKIIKELEASVVKWKDNKTVKEWDLYRVFWVLLSVIPNIATLGLANLNKGWVNFWYENQTQNCLRKMVQKDLLVPVAADPASEHEEDQSTAAAV